jgi:hypothetical protein
MGDVFGFLPFGRGKEVNMNLNVILGFLDPRDPEEKAARRAVILGEISRGGRRYLWVAPATTYFQRKGVVPPGHVLIQAQSPCRKGSGFTPDIDVLVSVRDAAFFSADSPWLAESEVIGQLNLANDRRVWDRFVEEMRRFQPREVFFD